MKVAAIYARVSSDEQAGNHSLPSQVQQCLAYAQRAGLHVPGEYIFPGRLYGSSILFRGTLSAQHSQSCCGPGAQASARAPTR